MSDVRPIIRARLAELRDQGPPTTIVALADRVGVDPGQLHREMAKGLTNPERRQAVADALGLEIGGVL